MVQPTKVSELKVGDTILLFSNGMKVVSIEQVETITEEGGGFRLQLTTAEFFANRDDEVSVWIQE